jgi:hypothetical protein
MIVPVGSEHKIEKIYSSLILILSNDYEYFGLFRTAKLHF